LCRQLGLETAALFVYKVNVEEGAVCEKLSPNSVPHLVFPKSAGS
jgi:hypothetical protein